MRVDDVAGNVCCPYPKPGTNTTTSSKASLRASLNLSLSARPELSWYMPPPRVALESP
jgi:hypothetical protein